MIRSVVTIGKFDGVHLGHQAVIAALKERAGEKEVVVITFDRHPADLFAPGKAPLPILSIAGRESALLAAGADRVVCLPFTKELADLSPREFVEKYLVEELSAALVVVGHDFKFGKAGAGNPELLEEFGKEFGFSVELADEVCEEGGTRISSSSVREAILSGNVEAAAQMLGRQHSVSGEVVHGLKRGKELGFPTANLSEDSEGLIPATGVYAGSIQLDGKTYVAAISVGDNPTFNDVTRNQVEAYALDAEFDAYGKIATVSFAKRIRGNEAFPDVEALKVQIAADVETVRAISLQ